MRTRTLALPVALLLLAGSCGDDDSLDLEGLADESADDSEESSPSDDQADSEADAGTSDGDDEADADTSDGDDDEADNSGDDSADAKEPLEADAKQGGVTVSEFFDTGVSTSTEECIVDGLVADPDLLAAVVAIGPDGEISDLEESDQVATIDLGLSCATTEEISSSIQSGFGADVASEAFAGETSDCVADRLTDDSNPDRAELLLGLVAISEDRPPSAEQGDLFVSLMIDCVDPTVIIDSALDSVVDDPQLEAAVDRPCLDSAMGDTAYLEELWGLFLADPDADFEQLAPDQQLQIVSPFFDCVSFGTVVAASAAADGVELSSETIACIDDAIDIDAILNAFVSGNELDESQFVAAVLPCLSAEELGALAG